MNDSSAERCCDTAGSGTSLCSAAQNPPISLEGPGHEVVATNPKHVTVTDSLNKIHLGCCPQLRKISKRFWRASGDALDIVRAVGPETMCEAGCARGATQYGRGRRKFGIHGLPTLFLLPWLCVIYKLLFPPLPCTRVGNSEWAQ